MRKVQKKAILKEPKEIVVKIDPQEIRSGIVVPKVVYKVHATVEKDEVFHGLILPIPKVLLYYLTKKELMVISVILEQTIERGECTMSIGDISKRAYIGLSAVSNALYTLRKIGLLKEAPNGKPGAGRLRKINYVALQYLNDLVEGEDPGIYPRLRKNSRKKDIMNLTKEDVRNAYDQYVLPPDHDPAEEEEYD